MLIRETYVQIKSDVDDSAGTCACHMRLDQIEKLPAPGDEG